MFTKLGFDSQILICEIGVGYSHDCIGTIMIPNAASPYRVLVIDDEPGMRSLMRRGLRLAGYVVETVDGGEAGLEAASRERPDLVLLDLMMPGLDGFETLERLCAIEPRPKVIVLSGRDEPEDRLRAASANLFLVKPIAFDQLLESIQAAIALPLISSLG
jgi:DNA-binding response OmpR family regulator